MKYLWSSSEVDTRVTCLLVTDCFDHTDVINCLSIGFELFKFL